MDDSEGLRSIAAWVTAGPVGDMETATADYSRPSSYLHVKRIISKPSPTYFFIIRTDIRTVRRVHLRLAGPAKIPASVQSSGSSAVFGCACVVTFLCVCFSRAVSTWRRGRESRRKSGWIPRAAAYLSSIFASKHVFTSLHSVHKKLICHFSSDRKLLSRLTLTQSLVFP